MLTYVGSLFLSAAVPVVATVFATALADLEARIAALQAALPSFTPPTVQLQLAQSIVASIEQSIALGIVPPSIDLQIGLFLAQIVELEAALGVVLDIKGLFAAAGVHVYVYDGDANDFGGELTTELAGGFPGGSGPTEHTNAIVFATTSGATWTAMAQVFQVTP
jgi:hypothetical protein